MRIFKNRGDIFFSKTNKEKSLEQRLLLAGLAIVLSFTVVFVIFVGARYDFSAKEFFKPEGLEITAVSGDDEDYQLPQVSGKTNFAVLVSGENELLFSYIMQVDLDNTSYKLAAVRGNTNTDGTTLNKVFQQSGAENCVNAIASLFDTNIDYYISLTTEQYARLYDSFGAVTYPIISDIRYKNNDLAVPINFRIKAGEQSIKGLMAINLVRYYLDVQNNASIANDILLTVMSQQINKKNNENSQELFQDIVTNSVTNITVREYTKSADALMVLTDERAGVSIYSSPVEYDDNNNITKDSLKNAKGYFVE